MDKKVRSTTLQHSIVLVAVAASSRVVGSFSDL